MTPEEEDAQFRDTAYFLRLRDWLRANLPATKWRRKKMGRPPGSEITLDMLEAGVDRLRLEKLYQWRLAGECRIGVSTLKDYLASHPDVWPALKERHRSLR